MTCKPEVVGDSDAVVGPVLIMVPDVVDHSTIAFNRTPPLMGRPLKLNDWTSKL